MSFADRRRKIDGLHARVFLLADVPKWLKNLRLHKYDVFFAQMTYDDMMNLTMERLKDLGITDGACSKILLNIKKLKERPAVLKQCLLDLSSGQAELANVIVQLSEVLSTPIRSKQLEPENSTEDDLPQLIVQILENGKRALPCPRAAASLRSV